MNEPKVSALPHLLSPPPQHTAPHSSAAITAQWRAFAISMRSLGRRLDSMEAATSTEHDNTITAPTLMRNPTLIPRPKKPVVPGEITPARRINGLMD